MTLSNTVIEKYLLAGKIAKSALRYGEKLVRTRKKITVLELAEEIEKFIMSSGGSLAFPCNIGINEVAAHFTPLMNDIMILPGEGLVKIDVGVHIDGYIADAAITIPLSDEHEEIVEVNREILEDVIKHVYVGVKLGDLGKLVEQKARRYGYQPISNLSGHLIDKYNLHAGKHVPNVWQPFTGRISDNEVYAIEPFITYAEGSGSVKERRDDIRIYSLSKIKKMKDPQCEEMRKYILTKYFKLPFTPRWFYKEFGKSSINMINDLFKQGVLRGYPVLVEKKNVYVSQFEHTVIIYNNDIIVITM